MIVEGRPFRGFCAFIGKEEEGKRERKNRRLARRECPLVLPVPLCE